MKIAPSEVREGETFVGNVQSDNVPADLASLKTARLGTVAVDIDGKQLPACYRPLFIARTEDGAHDRIMMERFNSIRSR